MKTKFAKMFLIGLALASSSFVFSSERYLVKAKVCKHEELGDYLGSAIKGANMMKEQCYAAGYDKPMNIVVLKHEYFFFCGVYKATFECVNNQ